MSDNDVATSRPERRWRVYWISPLEVMRLLLPGDGGFLTVGRLEGVPPDVAVVAVYGETLPSRIALVLSHPAFDPVPEGALPPDAGQVWWEVVRVRRVSDDPKSSDHWAVEPDVVTSPARR